MAFRIISTGATTLQRRESMTLLVCGIFKELWMLQRKSVSTLFLELALTLTLKWYVKTKMDGMQLVFVSWYRLTVKDCGGLPSWLMNMKSPARKDNEEYKGHWEEWLKEVDKYLVPNQITHNGNIILNQIGKSRWWYREMLLIICWHCVSTENEYADNTDSKYMQDLIDFFEADGIVVPSTFNDPNTGNHFASGEGSVDIYGILNHLDHARKTPFNMQNRLGCLSPRIRLQSSRCLAHQRSKLLPRVPWKDQS